MTRIHPLGLCGLALVLLVALVAFPLRASAQTLDYDHNGSRMQVTRTGQQVQITYRTPREGIAAQGVTPGTLLFRGTLDPNDYLSGMARIFRRGCGVIDYYVYGDFALGRDFRLSGAAPVLAPQGCRVVNNVYDGPNANLVFSVRAQLPTPQPAPGPAPRPVAATRFCVLGVDTALNMRTGPGMQWGVIGRIAGGSCAVMAAAPESGGWQPVEHDGQFGWVATRYLRAW